MNRRVLNGLAHLIGLYLFTGNVYFRISWSVPNLNITTSTFYENLELPNSLILWSFVHPKIDICNTHAIEIKYTRTSWRPFRSKAALLIWCFQIVFKNWHFIYEHQRLCAFLYGLGMNAIQDSLKRYDLSQGVTKCSKTSHMLSHNEPHIGTPSQQPMQRHLYLMFILWLPELYVHSYKELLSSVKGKICNTLVIFKPKWRDVRAWVP